MPDANDMDLVREFARHNSEAAFTELVRRHINLVYSVARRCTGNDGDAHDVTQAVFIILARKAAGLREKTLLTGWLYETTRFTAARLLRTNARRHAREQEAYMQSTLNEADTAAVWTQLSPHLEAAMSKLAAADRALLVLRFYENKSGPEAAALLGIREDAAHKRVTRAIEKLRKFFAQRGVTLSGATIAGAVSANSVQAAPVTLVKTISAIAVAKGAVATTSTLTLIKGALKAMTWSKAKTAIVAGAIILLAAGATTITVEKIIKPAAPFVRIEGKGQIELYDWHGKSRVVETANLVILTDGKSYRISIVSKGDGTLTNDSDDMQAEYGCDGVDTFVLSDQPSPYHQTRESFAAFAYRGRFPNADGAYFIPMVVQSAWMAYCSGDYFNVSSNQTGLQLGNEFSMVWPDYVTNQVIYWPDSTLPKNITGWSRNWIILSRTNSNQQMEADELKQYPDGFKAWTFTTSDPVMVGNIKVPRQFTLETFFPKPPDTATTGDETQPLRKATFIADSIEVGKGRFDPLPQVTVPDLKVIDSRFEDIVGNFVITSHATPKGWPVRGSGEFKQAAAQANKIASENGDIIQSHLKKLRVITPP